MTEVSIRDLRNHGGEVIDRASSGERVVITRSGKPVAELHALTSPPLTASALLRRWMRLPSLDADAFRADVDNVLDSQL